MTNQLELATLKRHWIDQSFNRFCAMHYNQFTADDLHKILEQPPHDGWWGCLMAKLRYEGRITEIGRVKSSRPERNGAKISLWQVK